MPSFEHRDATDRMLSSQEQQDMFKVKNDEQFSDEFVNELHNNETFHAEFIADMTKYAADVLLWRKASGITDDVEQIKTTDPIRHAYYILQSKHPELPDLLSGHNQTLVEMGKLAPLYQGTDQDIIAGATERKETQKNNTIALQELRQEVTMSIGTKGDVAINNLDDIPPTQSHGKVILDQYETMTRPLTLSNILATDDSFQTFETSLRAEDPENPLPWLTHLIHTINQKITDPDMQLTSIKYIDGLFVFCTNGTCNVTPLANRDDFSSYLTSLQTPLMAQYDELGNLTASSSYENNMNLGSTTTYKSLSVYDRSNRYQNRSDLLDHLPPDSLLLFGSDSCPGCSVLADKIGAINPAVPVIYIDTAINDYHRGNILMSEGYRGIPFLGVNTNMELTPYESTDIHYSRAGIDKTLRDTHSSIG